MVLIEIYMCANFIGDCMNKVIDFIDYKKQKEDKILEEEYKEFIKLMKYFVSATKPKYNIVNVYLNKNNCHVFKDENDNEIMKEFIQELINELGTEEINYNDLLVSALMDASPKKIKIHNKENIESNLTKTLIDIFGKRLEFIS